MQARSGWEIKPEENEETFNEVLERKCPPGRRLSLEFDGSCAIHGVATKQL